jgi:hypothetical protein
VGRVALPGRRRTQRVGPVRRRRAPARRRAGGVPGPPSAAGPAAPGAWSVVDLGREVAYSGCPGAQVVASFAGRTLAGPKAKGCRGTVAVPAREWLTAAGWRDGTALSLSLVSGKRSTPLAYKHLQPDLGRVVAGTPRPVPAAGDPQGDVSSLLMQQGDAVDLGVVDLRGVYAVLVRAAGYLSFELRTGSTVVASGTAGHARPDWVGKPRGTGERYESATAELTKAPSGPVHLVLAVTEGAGAVNYLDLTGSGAMSSYRFPTPLPKATKVFDGSIKGWKQIGPGTFSVDQGDLKATGPSAEWGWLYNPRVRLTNFVLRLRVKESAFGANGGILLRHGTDENNYLTSFTADEVQVTDVNTEYTGGVDHVATALRQPQSSPGEWSTFEIVANGPRLLVRVNGVVTADHDQTAGCNLPSVPCSGGAYGGYGTGGSGYLGFEAELKDVWYSDVLVHDCGVTDAVRQTSSDPVCALP